MPKELNALCLTAAWASLVQTAYDQQRLCRLYSSAHFNDTFPEHTPPEILNSSLDSVVLTMKALGIDKACPQLSWLLANVSQSLCVPPLLWYGSESQGASEQSDERSNRPLMCFVASWLPLKLASIAEDVLSSPSSRHCVTDGGGGGSSHV